MPHLPVDKIIELLDLKPLPSEGGFYRETYRSDERNLHQCSLTTSIYYLLTQETRSAMHRLPSDEIFHFYLGDPVAMLRLYPDGDATVVTLGNDLAAGQSPQILVPHGVWQGARLAEGGRFALLGSTVSPGFEFADYVAGNREQLIKQYPDQADLIRHLTSPAG